MSDYKNIQLLVIFIQWRNSHYIS